jgi:hypothetical protein
MRQSRTSKCKLHGGASSGPATESGKKKIAVSKTTHGSSARKDRAQLVRESVALMHFEDIGYIIGMLSGPRTRGRKPQGYIPIKTLGQAIEFVQRHLSNSPDGRRTKFHSQPLEPHTS